MLKHEQETEKFKRKTHWKSLKKTSVEVPKVSSSASTPSGSLGDVAGNGDSKDLHNSQPGSNVPSDSSQLSPEKLAIPQCNSLWIATNSHRIKWQWFEVSPSSCIFSTMMSRCRSQKSTKIGVIPSTSSSLRLQDSVPGCTWTTSTGVGSVVMSSCPLLASGSIWGGWRYSI